MTVPTGWRCPRCELVLAPSVAEHRCAPPSAGVTTTVAGPQPFQPTTVSVTPDTWATASVTSGHLTAAPVTHYRAADGTITEANPGRLEIAGGTAA